MAVWIVPAADKEAVKNYPKTLSASISATRLAKLHDLMGTSVPTGELFAWGFPTGDRNRSLYAEMVPGDICLFYVKSDEGGIYGWGARVASVPRAHHTKGDNDLAAKISNILWDSRDFLPYFLQRPIQILATPRTLSESLDREGKYMSHSPQGSMKISNLQRSTLAIEEHGGLDDWAIDFIEAHAVSPLKRKFLIDYFNAPDGDSLLPDRIEEAQVLLPRLSEYKSAGSTTSHFARRSTQSKYVGDIGEEAVLRHLRTSLSPLEADTLTWVANEKRKPGWDIEYVDLTGNMIAVEVKSTSADKMQSFEITANELNEAAKLGVRYHLYLVSNCLKSSQRRLEIIRDPVTHLGVRISPIIFRYS